jgi:hypothetical protein
MKAGFASAASADTTTTCGISGSVPSMKKNVCASIESDFNWRVAVSPRITSRNRDREATGERNASMSSAVPVTIDCR